MESGSYLEYVKSSRQLNIHRYYTYLPDKLVFQEEKYLFKEFDKIINNIILNLISMANNSTIWIPLSGGRDSALIISKLIENNYKNVRSRRQIGPYTNIFGMNMIKIRENIINIPIVSCKKTTSFGTALLAFNSK